MKTAKELKEKAKMIYNYHFTPNELQSFIAQLCKEQRESILRTCKFSSDGQYYYASEDDILNAPTPDI